MVFLITPLLSIAFNYLHRFFFLSFKREYTFSGININVTRILFGQSLAIGSI